MLAEEDIWSGHAWIAVNSTNGQARSTQTRCQTLHLGPTSDRPLPGQQGSSQVHAQAQHTTAMTCTTQTTRVMLPSYGLASSPLTASTGHRKHGLYRWFVCACFVPDLKRCFSSSDRVLETAIHVGNMSPTGFVTVSSNQLSLDRVYLAH